MKHFKKVCADAGGKLIVIDFTATWCGPCKMIAPKFEEISNTATNAVLVKVDVDSVEDVTSAFGVRSMPTFVFIRISDPSKEPWEAPNKLEQFSGANEGNLRATITKHKGGL